MRGDLNLFLQTQKLQKIHCESLEIEWPVNSYKHMEQKGTFLKLKIQTHFLKLED